MELAAAGGGPAAAAAAEMVPGFLLPARDVTVDESTSGFVGRGALGVVRRGTYNGQAAAFKSLHMLRTDAASVAEHGGRLRKEERKFLVQKFLVECRLMKSFVHPNIVGFLGVVVDDTPEMEPRYLAMQYIPSGTLGDLIHSDDYEFLRTDDEGYLPLPTQALVLDGLFAALEYLAAQELIHRDVKPDNILASVEDAQLLKVNCFFTLQARKEQTHT